MWSPSRIDEMKSSLVLVSALVFSLLKNEWNFEEDWLAEDDIIEISAISTWEKNQLVNNNKKGYIGKKEEISTNKTIILTEKTVWWFSFDR